MDASLAPHGCDVSAVTYQTPLFDEFGPLVHHWHCRAHRKCDDVPTGLHFAELLVVLAVHSRHASARAATPARIVRSAWPRTRLTASATRCGRRVRAPVPALAQRARPEWARVPVRPSARLREVQRGRPSGGRRRSAPGGHPMPRRGAWWPPGWRRRARCRGRGCCSAYPAISVAANAIPTDHPPCSATRPKPRPNRLTPHRCRPAAQGSRSQTRLT
jgi:hypothetical protein